MYDLWKSVEISTDFHRCWTLYIIMQCAHCGTHRRKGIYTLRPYLTKRDLYRRLRMCTREDSSGTVYRYTVLVYCESWCGGWVGALSSGTLYCIGIPVLGAVAGAESSCVGKLRS